MHKTLKPLVAVIAAVFTATSGAVAQGRGDITIADSAVTPENITSTADGTVFFGSTSKGTIYRALPGAAQAQPWILASQHNLTNVLGVFADERSNTLWVCQNTAGGRGGAPVSGQTALRQFDLKTGAAKGSFPFPPNAGTCNDIAVAANGTAYVTESFRGRVYRLRQNATALEEWLSAPQELNGIDGIALLADGAVYFNDFFSGKLYRVPVNADGSAGAMLALDTSIPFTRPDGLRSTGRMTLIQAEGQGRATEITISGNRAEVRVLQEGLTGATGITVVGGNALVLVQRLKAVAVPYAAR